MSIQKYGAAEPIEPEADEETRRQAAANYGPEEREAMLKEQQDADDDTDEG